MSSYPIERRNHEPTYDLNSILRMEGEADVFSVRKWPNPGSGDSSDDDDDDDDDSDSGTDG